MLYHSKLIIPEFKVYSNVIVLTWLKTTSRFLNPAVAESTKMTPKIKWTNGVPGCGKTTWLIKNFDVKKDAVATTTTEAAKDLQEKLVQAHGKKAEKRVRTMASILVNGFREHDKRPRLIVDEALMNHFGTILTAGRLAEASEILLIGDDNQLPYIDRENLFRMAYSRPTAVAGIDQQLTCTYRNPMDVAYALSQVYDGIYSPKPIVRSLSIKGYQGEQISSHTPDTLFLVHTQEEKKALINKGYGAGEGSRVLTVHESQGLTFKSVVILQTKGRRMQIHDSVSHAIVAISRHTHTCVYYTDVTDDAVSRFIHLAMDAPARHIVDYNLKMAIGDRNETAIKAITSITVK